MKKAYYEVYLIKGMSSQTLKKCKRKKTAERFAKEYEAKYGIRPIIGEVVNKVIAKDWYEVTKILIEEARKLNEEN